MSLKEILNKEDMDFLKGLAHQLKTQDRRGTNKPVIYQILDIDVRWDYSDSDGFDEIRIYDNDGNVLENLEEMRENIIKNLEMFEIEEQKVKDYCIDEIISLYKEAGYSVSYGHYEKVLKNGFLTMKSAEEHLQANKHHYHEKAHIFVSYAWRNPELEKLLEIIEKLDKEEN